MAMASCRMALLSLGICSAASSSMDILEGAAQLEASLESTFLETGLGEGSFFDHGDGFLARAPKEEAKCKDSNTWADSWGDGCQWYAASHKACAEWSDYGQMDNCPIACGTCAQLKSIELATPEAELTETSKTGLYTTNATTTLFDGGEYLVVRRGIELSVKITATPEAMADWSENILVNYVTWENDDKKTLTVEMNTAAPVTAEWGLVVAPVCQDKECTYKLRIPPTAPIGPFKLTAKLAGKEVQLSQILYVILNPYLPGNTEYIEDPKMIDDYVVADTGAVWKGAAGSTYPWNWNYGQYLPTNVNAMMKMMTIIPLAERGKVPRIARWLTYILGTKVLWGSWCTTPGCMDDAVQKPGYWTSTAPIFEEWLKNGFNSVKYGQCWVFSSITTTAGRSIGMGIRSVTNFNSAHGKPPYNKGIDEFYMRTADGKVDWEFKHPNAAESIWNFHVWNDALMSRPDLKNPKLGWQAMDATPQERSCEVLEDGEKICRSMCGPAPLDVLKSKEVDGGGETAFNAVDAGVSYDSAFIFGETNGDWRGFAPHKEFKLAACEAKGCKGTWVGDGYCDAKCNVPECDMDLGDCCEADCNKNVSGVKVYRSYKCGHGGYDCKGEASGWVEAFKNTLHIGQTISTKKPSGIPTTTAGIACQSWEEGFGGWGAGKTDTITGEKCTGLMCCNPDGSSAPWCFTSKTSGSYGNCRTDGVTTKYMTLNGYECGPWDSASLAGWVTKYAKDCPGNQCCNPDNSDKDWCAFSYEGGTAWGFCEAKTEHLVHDVTPDYKSAQMTTNLLQSTMDTPDLKVVGVLVAGYPLKFSAKIPSGSSPTITIVALQDGTSRILSKPKLVNNTKLGNKKHHAASFLEMPAAAPLSANKAQINVNSLGLINAMASQTNEEFAIEIPVSDYSEMLEEIGLNFRITLTVDTVTMVKDVTLAGPIGITSYDTGASFLGGAFLARNKLTTLNLNSGKNPNAWPMRLISGQPVESCSTPMTGKFALQVCNPFNAEKEVSVTFDQSVAQVCEDGMQCAASMASTFVAPAFTIKPNAVVEVITSDTEKPKLAFGDHCTTKSFMYTKKKCAEGLVTFIAKIGKLEFGEAVAL